MVAVLVGVAAAGGVVLADRAHWFDRDRRSVLHELSTVGAPPGFTTRRRSGTDTLPAGYDPALHLAAGYFVGRLTPAAMASTLTSWLTKAGLPASAGPVESQHCGSVTFGSSQEFGCGNFYRETASWRVWVTVANDEWALLPPTQQTETDVQLSVFVQHKRPLAKSLTPAKGRNGTPVSPGLTGTVLAGAAHAIPLDPALAVDGASFGPQGQLVTDGYPATVLPVAKGQQAQRLEVAAWPSVPDEVQALALDSPTVQLAEMGPDGALWVQVFNEGLHRFDPDGHVVNITGSRSNVAPLTDGPAIGQNGTVLGDQLAISADGTAWTTNAGHLARIRAGTVQIIGPDLTGVTSVVSDQHNGVYVGTARRLFHVGPDGAPTPVAEQTPFHRLSSLALAKDGSLFAVDGGRLRRVLPNGTVTTVAGTGTDSSDRAAFCAEPVPASAAGVPVSTMLSVAASPLGGVYLVGCNRLVQIGY